jgi:hypothetical protein
MKVVTVVVLCLVIASAFAADTDTDTDVEIPTTRPRKGRPTKGVKVIGKRFGGGQRVHYVPKGSPLARNPNPPQPKPAKPQEPRVIVEAEDVTRWNEDRKAPLLKAGVSPCQSQGGTCKDVGQCGGTTRSGLCPGPANIKCCFTGSAGNPGSCLANYDGSRVVAKALAYQSAYQSRGTKYSQSGRQYGISARLADCSSYVTSILEDTGYDCLFAAGRYTGYMNPQIRARGGYSQTAKAGDLVMWGGHTGIVVKVCGGGKYQMTAMGNSGARISPCLTPGQMASWGSGGWLGFWTPRP